MSRRDPLAEVVSVADARARDRRTDRRAPTAPTATLRLDLSEDALEALADALAPRVAALLAPVATSSPYLTVAEAAEYLRASRQRIYDLVSAGRLPRHKDGARLLLLRADLDAYLSDTCSDQENSSMDAHQRRAA